MKNPYEQKIITPKGVELVSSHEDVTEDREIRGKQVYADIQSKSVDETRLTCCCEYGDYIICAGFSGKLFFVERESLNVKYKEKISNSIIRCLKVIYSEKTMLISTDAGEIIAYDLENKNKQYYESSNSPIYNIVAKDSKIFITSERNGDIYEWEYISRMGIFRIKKLFTADSAVFAMDIIGEKLVVVNSLGKKFEYDFLKLKHKTAVICEDNVFCLKEGREETIFYGLSTGKIIYEEKGCDIEKLESHQDAVRDLVFSSQKKWMFSISKDRTVRAWHNGVPSVLTKVKDYLYQIIFVESHLCLYFVDGHGDIGAIHFHSDVDIADKIYLIN